MSNQYSGSSEAGPSNTGPSKADPSNAGPSNAGPSTPDPSTSDPKESPPPYVGPAPTPAPPTPAPPTRRASSLQKNFSYHPYDRKEAVKSQRKCLRLLYESCLPEIKVLRRHFVNMQYPISQLRSGDYSVPACHNKISILNTSFAEVDVLLAKLQANSDELVKRYDAYLAQKEAYDYWLGPQSAAMKTLKESVVPMWKYAPEMLEKYAYDVRDTLEDELRPRLRRYRAEVNEVEKGIALNGKWIGSRSS